MQLLPHILLTVHCEYRYDDLAISWVELGAKKSKFEKENLV